MNMDYKYYQYIYQKLVLKHKDWNIQREKPHKIFETPVDLIQIMNRIELKYGISLHKSAKINIEKFYIWCNECCGQINKEHIQTATYFVLYCCLADKILDSEKNFLNYKYMVYRDLENFIKMSDTVTGDLYEMYELRKKIQGFIKVKQQSGNSNILLIKEKINRAVRSEQFMATHSINDFDVSIKESLITDKSVEFVSAAFLIAVYDTINEQVVEVSETIGKIFGYIDDICDYVSDMETESLNSLLFVCPKTSEISGNMEWTTEKVDLAIKTLEKEVSKLKKTVGKEMYVFILNELWDWMADVRKKIE